MFWFYRAYFGAELESSSTLKKRKLLNPEEDFLNTSTLTSASDILDMIEEGKVMEEEGEIIKEGVDDIILQLDDDLQTAEKIDKTVEENSCVIFISQNQEDNVLNISSLSISDVSGGEFLSNSFKIIILFNRRHINSRLIQGTQILFCFYL